MSTHQLAPGTDRPVPGTIGPRHGRRDLPDSRRHSEAEMLTEVLQRLLGMRGAAVYGIVAALVFLEDAVLVGFVVPGETAAIIGGVAASLGQVQIAPMIVIVASAAIIGDSTGYWAGHLFGPRLLASRLLRPRRERLDQAREAIARRGGVAVFVGRHVAFLRTAMPALAGTAGMRYRTFLAYNAPGGVIWAVGNVFLGYLAGNSYATIERLVGRGTAIGSAVIVLLLLVVWRLHRRRRRAKRPDDTGTAGR